MSECTCLYVVLLCVSLISLSKPNVSTSIYVKSTTPLCLRHVKLQRAFLKCAHIQQVLLATMWSFVRLPNAQIQIWRPLRLAPFQFVCLQVNVLLTWPPPQSHYLVLFGLEAHCAGKVQLRSRRSFGPYSDIWQTGVPPPACIIQRAFFREFFFNCQPVSEPLTEVCVCVCVCWSRMIDSY